MYRTFLVCALCITLFSSPSEATNPCLPYLEFSRQFWGAKFLEGYEAFDFSRHPMTTGVEVEFVVPKRKLWGPRGRLFTDNQTRRRLAEIVRRTIRKNLPDIEVKIIRKKLSRNADYYYIIQYELDGRTYEYQIKEESTVTRSHSLVGTELTTPKLYNQQDINLFYNILEQLQVRGKIKTTHKSEVHVHIGFPGAQAQEIALALSLFAAFEQQIYEAFAVLPHRQEASTRFLNEELIHHLRGIRTGDSMTIQDIESRTHTRNHGLNIKSLDWFKTLEFRLFNGSLKSEEIGPMIEFSQAFIRAIREKDPQLLRLLENRNLETLPFEQLAEALSLETSSSSHTIPMRSSAIR